MGVPEQPNGFGLVLAPDLEGLRPLFDALAERIAAEQGWTVVSPDPFPDHPEWDVHKRFAEMAHVDAAAQSEDILAAAEMTGCEQVGLLGFCFGGFLAYRAAVSGRFRACVGMYGPTRLPDVWRTGRDQVEPLDLLRSSEPCPLLAIYAGRDVLSPEEDIALIEEMPNVEVARYEHADHAFVHDWSRPNHRPADAADAMVRAFKFLRSHSGA